VFQLPIFISHYLRFEILAQPDNLYNPRKGGGLFWAGVRALSFRNVSVGEIPPEAGRGVRLPHRYVAEKTSPRALELKKSLPTLRKYELCKALVSLENS
jgi:hypothetical protein